MNALKIFEHQEFGQVRIVMRDGEPWFVAKDVAERLGYSNSRKAVADHCKNPCAAGGNDSLHLVNSNGYGLDPQTTLINQSDVLRLIVRSSLPAAERFEKWVFEEVLPSVINTGGYLMAHVDETPDQIMARAVLVAQDTIERMKGQLAALEQKTVEDRPLVGFAKAVQASEDTILVKQLAGFLKQNGIDIGQNRLFEWMRQNGYLCREQGERWNKPTQKAMNLGLFEVKESIGLNPDGTTRLFLTTKVTGKGQLYFLRKFGVGMELAATA